MKCHLHPAEAIGICAYCGRGLCPDCAKPATATSRLVCSPECFAILARNDKAMESILQKSVQSARASANYNYLCAALSAGGAIGAYFYLPLPFLIIFIGACSVIFLATGWWHGRIARKQSGS
jgi:hypothetical protein